MSLLQTFLWLKYSFWAFLIAHSLRAWGGLKEKAKCMSQGSENSENQKKDTNVDK